jgi:hypothetical protein
MKQIKNKRMKNYAYPVGDFLSGFSEDSKNPCGYELECQRMVIRGVQYLDDNQKIFDIVDTGGVKLGDKILKPLIDYMCLHEDDPHNSRGQSGAMVEHSVRIAFLAKKMGWETYIQKITKSNIGHNIPQE